MTTRTEKACEQGDGGWQVDDVTGVMEVIWMRVMRGLGGRRRGAKNLKEKNEEKENRKKENVTMAGQPNKLSSANGSWKAEMSN